MKLPMFFLGLALLSSLPINLCAQELTKESIPVLINVYKDLLKKDTIDLGRRRVFKAENEVYKVVDFYPSGVTASVKYSKEIPSSASFTEEGESMEYYENRILKRAKNHSEGKSHTSDFYNNGLSYKEYEADKTISVFDPEGKQLVRNGNGNSIEFSHLHGQPVLESGNYSNGNKTGVWRGFYESGDFYYEENYNDKGLVRGKSADSHGKFNHYKELEELPVFKGGERALYQYLARNVNYPREASIENLTGKVTVRFAIEKDGSVGSIELLNSVHPLLDREAERVISGMKGQWISGKLRGIPVKVYYTILITFSKG